MRLTDFTFQNNIKQNFEVVVYPNSNIESFQSVTPFMIMTSSKLLKTKQRINKTLKLSSSLQAKKYKPKYEFNPQEYWHQRRKQEIDQIEQKRQEIFQKLLNEDNREKFIKQMNDTKQLEAQKQAIETKIKQKLLKLINDKPESNNHQHADETEKESPKHKMQIRKPKFKMFEESFNNNADRDDVAAAEAKARKRLRRFRIMLHEFETWNMKIDRSQSTDLDLSYNPNHHKFKPQPKIESSKINPKSIQEETQMQTQIKEQNQLKFRNLGRLAWSLPEHVR